MLASIKKEDKIGISRISFLNHVRLWVKTFDELGIDGLKCIKKGRPVKDGRTI